MVNPKGILNMNELLMERAKEKGSPQRRSVTFNPKARCRRILNLEQYSESEYEDCFYTDGDIEQFIESTRKLAEALHFKEPKKETTSFVSETETKVASEKQGA